MFQFMSVYGLTLTFRSQDHSLAPHKQRHLLMWTTAHLKYKAEDLYKKSFEK